jgi:acetyl esterase/lipase
MSNACKKLWLALAALTALAALAQAGASFAGGLMDWPDLMDRPSPSPTHRIAYGPGPLQFGELWLPAGQGPFPVVLMIHGGCWRSSVARLGIMNWAADDLRRRGYAVWNIEYRGVDTPGGGYPGSFQDVAAAADALERLGPSYHLKTDRVLALGHSAGGHFALWLAARGRIPAGSVLRSAHPLPIAGVISLGGLPDLQLDRQQGVCGDGTLAALVGPSMPRHPDVYADTSPAAMGVGPDAETLISGAEDGISPPALAAAYLARMKGAHIRQFVLADTGHVELIAPGSAAWSRATESIDAFFRSP